MENIHIDFRFLEIDYELWALGEYLTSLEQQLPRLEDQKRARASVELREQKLDTDEDEVYLRHQEIDELVVQVVPRFFRGAFLVTLWAVYEAAIIEIAGYIRDKQGLALAMKDIRGENILRQARMYFDHVLHFPLLSDDQVQNRLEMLLTLRNAIAHANGRISAVSNEKSRRKIDQWLNSNIGIDTTHHGDIRFSEEFVQDAFSTVDESLRDLIARVRASY